MKLKFNRRGRGGRRGKKGFEKADSRFEIPSLDFKAQLPALIFLFLSIILCDPPRPLRLILPLFSDMCIELPAPE
jgi:hypothetical protein